MSDFQLSELYKGRVQVKFFPKSHQYWASVDGQKSKRKTGVTTFIGVLDKSRALGMWQQQITADFLLKLIEKGVPLNEELAIEAAIQNDIIRDEAADIGNQTHEWCEHYIKNKLGIPGYEETPDIPEHAESVVGVNSFLQWEKEHNVEWVSSERVVYSIDNDYIGTMDFEAKIDGELCVGDFKTSNGLYNGVRMQTAAYQAAAKEEKRTAYKGRWAIRLAKYSEAEHKRREERKAEIKATIAKIRGWSAKEAFVKPYEVFEAKYLDDSKDFYQRDLAAFHHAKALKQWSNDTDPFLKGKNW